MSTDGTGSSSDPQSDWTGAQWQQQWDDDLTHLNNLMNTSNNNPHDHDGTFMAIAYIASVMFLFIGDYNEDYKMGQQSKVQNQLTEIDDRRNKIETDFDVCATPNPDGSNTPTTAQDLAAQDALNQYYGYTDPTTGKHVEGLNELLTQGKSEGLFDSSFVSSVQQEFIPTTTDPTTGKVTHTDGGIFGPDWQSNQGDGLGTYWYGLWNPITGSDETPDSTDTSIQPVTNGLTAVSSDVSSQSSIVQSKLNVYESDDENYQSMTHSTMSNIVDMEKQSNTAMQSAS